MWLFKINKIPLLAPLNLWTKVTVGHNALSVTCRKLSLYYTWYLESLKMTGTPWCHMQHKHKGWDSLSLHSLQVNLKQYVPHYVITSGKGEGRYADNSLKILYFHLWISHLYTTGFLCYAYSVLVQSFTFWSCRASPRVISKVYILFLRTMADIGETVLPGCICVWSNVVNPK